MLNPDVYYDLAREFIYLADENPELSSRFVLSGKEPLAALKDFITKVEFVKYENWSFEESDVRCSPYVVSIDWSHDITIRVDLEDSHVKWMIRWALSHTKRFDISVRDPLPENITDLLLKNPSFTKVRIDNGDLSTAKLLVNSRRFDYISITSFTAKDWNDVHIDTEELDFFGVSLEEILKAESIKANSLIIGPVDEDFIESLTTTDISYVFQSVKTLSVSYVDARPLYHPQKVLDSLEFWNTKLVNLELLVLNFCDMFDYVEYDSRRRTFSMQPSALKNLVNYEDKLTGYKGKLKVKFTHEIKYEMYPRPPKIVVENYCKGLEKELSEYKYSFQTKNGWNEHHFKKSRMITENFEANINIQLTYL
ncbi:hypothetical protein FO519_009865, partial [Halicephalobus sp. NKZ332]